VLRTSEFALRAAGRAHAAGGCCWCRWCFWQPCACCCSRASGETQALLDDWAAHAVFLPLFAFGLLLARRPVLQAQLQALRWPALGLASWAVLALCPVLHPGWLSLP
jgi:hypothetical protein